MNLGFAGGGTVTAHGGGAPRRKWYSPEIESLLAAQTLAATMWSSGLISNKQRDKILDKIETGLKKAEYGKRFPEQPEKRNPWRSKPRGKH